MTSIPLHGLDDVGNEVVSAFELHIDVSPSAIDLNPQFYEAVVNDDSAADHGDRYKQLPHAKTPVSRKGRRHEAVGDPKGE
jgi:hypothetical protein